jgi:hypothetical protein
MLDEYEVQEPLNTPEMSDAEVSAQEPTEQTVANQNPEQTGKTDEQNKRLYARAKAAEEELKKLKSQLKSPSNERSNSIDPFDLARVVSSLKDYSSEEIDMARIIAQAKNISPDQAVKTDEFKTFSFGHREKIAKETKVPNPSSPNFASNLPDGKDIANMSPEEHRKFEREAAERMSGKSGI